MWALALGVRRALSAGFAVVIVLACAGVANAQGGAYTRYVAESASFVTYSLSAAVSSGSLSLKINISGKITEQTVTEVSKAVSMLKEMGKIARADNPQLVDNEWPLEVSLWSAGGSVDAAIEIGRLLRSLDATVEVSQEIVCESSCVLILAGGTKRRMKGYIGIHRPYFETWTKSPTTAEVSVAMGRMRDKLVAYLSDMNVDRALADDMMKIAPENIRYL